MNDKNTGEIILYQPDDTIRLEVRIEDETVWLSQAQMTALFNRDKSVISRHISNIFKEEELIMDSVVANFATTAADGKAYQVEYYNLDVIISVGYRVKSKQGTKFRQWATPVIREYLLRGYVFDQRMNRIEKFAIETERRVYETENEIAKLKLYIDAVLSDYNNINENTRIELENINQLLSVSNIQFSEIYQALMELAEHKKELDKPRKKIGFHTEN